MTALLHPDLDTAVPRCARPLVALATQLQGSVAIRPAETRAAAEAAVERFEQTLTEAGADARTVAVASYLLCVWLDEAGAWPDGGLLLAFHGEADGGTRVFELLERLLAEPQANRPLLLLFHTALSLGLRGRWRTAADGARRIEAWRQRLATALQLETSPLAQPLSAHWQPVRLPRRPGRERRILASGLLLLALVGVGIFSASQVLLARQVDGVFASLQGLEQAGMGSASELGAGPGVALGSAAAPAPGRLATPLSTPSVEGLRVRDEVTRSLVVVSADGLFRADTAQLAAERVPLLARIGQALAAQPGRVLVTAYARADSSRPARLSSTLQLADEWALQVAQALQPLLPAGSLTTEGRVERADTRAADAPARIEITLFPQRAAGDAGRSP